MNKTKTVISTLGGIFAAIIMAGCVSATADEPSVCDSKNVVFDLPTLPSVPPNAPSDYSATIPSLSTTTTSVDFSTTLNKVSDIADSVQIAVNQLVLSNPNGQFDWVQNLSVSINDGDAGPSVVIATYTASNVSGSAPLTPTLVASNDTIFQYFKAGPVELTITLGSATVNASTLSMLESLNGNIGTTISICMDVNGHVSKSL